MSKTYFNNKNILTELFEFELSIILRLRLIIFSYITLLIALVTPVGYKIGNISSRTPETLAEVQLKINFFTEFCSWLSCDIECLDVF